jgi:hypothetical protein
MIYAYLYYFIILSMLMYCITSVSMVEKSLQGSEPAGKPHRRPCCAGKPRDDVDGTRLFHAFLASRK